MACEYVCDGCGRRVEAGKRGWAWERPAGWVQRACQETGEIRDWCSEECRQRSSGDEKHPKQGR